MVCQSRNMDLYFIDVSFLFGLRTGMAGDKDGGGAFETTGEENNSMKEVKHRKQILVVKSANKSSTKGVLSAQWPVSA